MFHDVGRIRAYRRAEAWQARPLYYETGWIEAGDPHSDAGVPANGVAGKAATLTVYRAPVAKRQVRAYPLVKSMMALSSGISFSCLTGFSSARMGERGRAP